MPRTSLYWLYIFISRLEADVTAFMARRLVTVPPAFSRPHTEARSRFRCLAVSITGLCPNAHCKRHFTLPLRQMPNAVFTRQHVCKPISRRLMSLMSEAFNATEILLRYTFALILIWLALICLFTILRIPRPATESASATLLMRRDVMLFRRADFLY